jgi:uncharacterized spore protein YtfJ
MDQINLNDNLDMLFHSLENFTQKEGVIGKPVTQGTRTFMPVVSFTIGYGGGNAEMGSGNTSTSGTGSFSSRTGTGALGLGAKLNTEAVIMIDDQSQNVQMMPVSSSAGQLVDKIPQIISGMGQNKQSQSGGQQGQQGQQSQQGQ